MPIDNVTGHARVDIFHALKSLPKIKSNAKKFPVLTNLIFFSLTFFLNVIILPLTNAQLVLDDVFVKIISVSLCLKFTYAVQLMITLNLLASDIGTLCNSQTYVICLYETFLVLLFKTMTIESN